MSVLHLIVMLALLCSKHALCLVNVLEICLVSVLVLYYL